MSEENKLATSQQKNDVQTQPTLQDYIKMEGVITEKHLNISSVSTPRHFVEEKNGFDYVDEGYMRNLLTKYYPIWNWEIISYQFVGDTAIAVHGRLKIVDNGIHRSFDAIAAHRIAKNNKGYVDLSNDLKSANTDTFKVAVNRLCNIADDVYRKRIEDIELSEEQRNTIIEELKGTPEKFSEDVINKIDSTLINTTNLDAAIRKIKQVKTEGAKNG